MSNLFTNHRPASEACLLITFVLFSLGFQNFYSEDKYLSLDEILVLAVNATSIVVAFCWLVYVRTDHQIEEKKISGWGWGWRFMVCHIIATFTGFFLETGLKSIVEIQPLLGLILVMVLYFLSFMASALIFFGKNRKYKLKRIMLMP